MTQLYVLINKMLLLHPGKLKLINEPKQTKMSLYITQYDEHVVLLTSEGLNQQQAMRGNDDCCSQTNTL